MDYPIPENGLIMIINDINYYHSSFLSAFELKYYAVPFQYLRYPNIFTFIMQSSIFIENIYYHEYNTVIAPRT